MPSAAALTLLVAMSAVLGCGAARGRGPLAVLGLLAAAQLAGHFALAAGAEHAHAHAATDPWLMTLAHSVATVLCAVLIVAVDRLMAVAASTLRALEWISHRPMWQDFATPFCEPELRATHRTHEPISRRGPPVLCAL